MGRLFTRSLVPEDQAVPHLEDVCGTEAEEGGGGEPLCSGVQMQMWVIIPKPCNIVFVCVFPVSVSGMWD